MYSLYNQIQIKGLYFFCTRFNTKEKKKKYVVLKPGETIEQVFFVINMQIYNKYGKDGFLTLIYGDKNIGLGGINNMEKWLIRIVILLAAVWLFLYAYPLYLVYQHGGLNAVWNTVSFFRKETR